ASTTPPTTAAPPASTNAPTTTAPPAPKAPASALGFDTCEAPSVDQMQVWRQTSPYGVAAVYIGGGMRMCRNAVLDTPAWVNAVVAQGWRLMPTYVGPQAPCSGFRNTMDWRRPIDHGAEAARDAAWAAINAGFPPGAPIYYDLENYTRSAGCTWA